MNNGGTFQIRRTMAAALGCALAFVAAGPVNGASAASAARHTSGGVAVPEPLQSARPHIGGCTIGHSCYYDGHNATLWMWDAPSCGSFDLGKFNPPLNDRISSIVNYGGGDVVVYNYVGGENPWYRIAEIVPNSEYDLNGTFDNVADRIDVHC